MPRKTNITARILGANFFLDSLDEELAELARRGTTAGRELESLIRKKLEERGATWPADEMGRAALVHFLLSRPDAWAAKVRHAWKSKSEKPGRLTMDGARRGK